MLFPGQDGRVKKCEPQNNQAANNAQDDRFAASLLGRCPHVENIRLTRTSATDMVEENRLLLRFALSIGMYLLPTHTIPTGFWGGF